MKTLEGQDITWRAATQSVGSALRIAPDFVATSADEVIGVETAVTARYMRDQGRYVIKAVSNTATSDDVELNYPTIAKIGLQAIMQSAAPRCIFVTLDDETDSSATWISIEQLTTREGRILPPLLASEVIRRGSSDARMDAIEVLYGSAALAGLPPAKLIQRELGIPHRTASQWIIDARKAGRLTGMNYNAGRPAGG